MSKVKALTEAQANRLRLKSNLEVIQGKRSDRAMGAIMGISQATYSRRRNDPTTLTFSEIYLICKDSGIDISDFVGRSLRIAT